MMGKLHYEAKFSVPAGRKPIPDLTLGDVTALEAAVRTVQHAEAVIGPLGWDWEQGESGEAWDFTATDVRTEKRVLVGFPGRGPEGRRIEVYATMTRQKRTRSTDEGGGA